MSLAAEIGHEAVVKPLLDSPDIAADTRDESVMTSLSLADENEQMGLSLERPDVETDSENLMDNTSLTWAANCHSAVEKLLTDRIATHQAVRSSR